MANKKISFELDIDGKPIDVVIDKTLNLKQAVRELTKELNKTQEGTKEFTLLSNKLNETKDNVDRVNAKSREFFSTLSLLPGPVGDFSNKIDGSLSLLKTFSGFKLSDIKNQLVGLGEDVVGIASGIGKLTGLTKLWGITNTLVSKGLKLMGIEAATTTALVRGLSLAIASTGIGLLVVALGYLIGKLMEVGTTADTTATKVARLNREFTKLETDSKMAGDQTLARMKAQGATEEQLFQQRKKNKQTELDNARKEFKLYQGQMTAAEIMDQKGQQGYKDALAKRLEAEKKIKQGKHEMVMLDLEEQNRVRLEEEKNSNEDLQKKKELGDKTAQLNKQQKEKIAADNKTADQASIDLERENAALKEQDQRKREDIDLQNLKKAEVDKINELEISEEKKKTILAQIDVKYAAKQTDVDKKRKEDDAKEAKEWADKLAEMHINAIENQQEKEKAELKKGYDKTKEDLDKALADKKISQQQYDQGVIDAKKALNVATEKVDKDKNVKDLEDQLALDESRLKALKEGTEEYFAQQRKIEDDAYAIQLAKTKAGTKEREKVEQDHTAVMKAIAKSEKEYKEQLLLQTIDMYGQFGSSLQQLAGKNKGLAKTGLLIEKAAGIATIIINTQKAASKAGYFSPLGIATIIAGAASVATSIAAAMKGIQEIDASGSGSGSSSSAPAANSAAALTAQNPNYGDGGLLDGPRHAQGGMTINAEGGEAVMTRGAVTMFKPLLSMMNQAGGGTSFTKGAAGQAGYDNPTTSSSSIMEPQIIKTYVVENELTTIQHKQARLKDLSTL